MSKVGILETLKKPILLENYNLPEDLEARIEAFVEHCNHRRYHDSLSSLTPADFYFGRGRTILLKRERIEREAIGHRRLRPAGSPLRMINKIC